METTRRQRDVWYDLDNAANIFPAISDERNTNVFRLSCELKENIDKELLQKALDDAMKTFGSFQVIMRRGLFWFYLERTSERPAVRFESERPMSRLFYANRKELLFTVSYYRRRINLEVFHSVSDGGGAMQLLRSVVYRYIALAHPDAMPQQPPPLDGQASPATKAEDSFSHHYNPAEKKSPFKQKAYSVTGTPMPAGSLRIITGSLPTAELLAFVKARGVTATAYLAALLITAIYTEQMPARARKKPIGVTIPVDLRKHFRSETARNFFGIADVVYRFDGGPADFDKVLESVRSQLKSQLDPDELAARMNYTMSVQKNIFARAVPLFLKNLVLRAAYQKAEHTTTAALSNLGRVTMPERMGEYIEGFSALLNPTPIHRIKAAVCSYGENFQISFTASIAETRVQRYIFRHLAAEGLDVTITCNGVDDDEVL